MKNARSENNVESREVIGVHGAGLGVRFEDLLDYRIKIRRLSDFLKVVRSIDKEHIHIRTVNDFEVGENIHCVLLTRGTFSRERRTVTGRITIKGGKKHLVGFETMHETSKRSPLFSFGPGTKLVLYKEYEIYWKILSYEIVWFWDTIKCDNRNFIHLIGMTNRLF